MNTLKAKAEHYRSRWDITNPGGVVIFFNGEAQGWVNEIRNPEHWAPGCVAIDQEGNQWESCGGNNYDGAKEWRQIHNDKR